MVFTQLPLQRLPRNLHLSALYRIVRALADDITTRLLGSSLPRFQQDGQTCRERCDWYNQSEKVHAPTKLSIGQSIQQYVNLDFTNWLETSLNVNTR